ncbi:hypothetical protein KIPB_015568, partial [Kipferlia bialata]|eukprot:g15568.t1
MSGRDAVTEADTDTRAEIQAVQRVAQRLREGVTNVSDAMAADAETVQQLRGQVVANKDGADAAQQHVTE